MRLLKEYDIVGSDFNKAGEAAEQMKKVLKQIGIDPVVIKKASIAAYEAEMNIVIHAFRGKLILGVTPTYIEIHAKDEGPGIPDIHKALQEGFSTASDKIKELGFGAGMGIPNMKKSADIFEISSEIGKGTKIRMVIKIQRH